MVLGLLIGIGAVAAIVHHKKKDKRQRRCQRGNQDFTRNPNQSEIMREVNNEGYYQQPSQSTEKVNHWKGEKSYPVKEEPYHPPNAPPYYTRDVPGYHPTGQEVYYKGEKAPQGL